MSMGGSTGTLNGATEMIFEKSSGHSHLPKDKEHEKARFSSSRTLRAGWKKEAQYVQSL